MPRAQRAEKRRNVRVERVGRILDLAPHCFRDLRVGLPAVDQPPDQRADLVHSEVLARADVEQDGALVVGQRLMMNLGILLKRSQRGYEKPCELQEYSPNLSVVQTCQSPTFGPPPPARVNVCALIEPYSMRAGASYFGLDWESCSVNVSLSRKQPTPRDT
jgi:hypothetical protein